MNARRRQAGEGQNSVFAVGSNFYLNACVGRNGGPYSEFDYARGYFQAASMLVDQIMQGVRPLDLLIYPVTYLYRHGIELGLKSLVEYLSATFNEPKTHSMNHKLTDDWKQVKVLLANYNVFDVDGERVTRVEKIITDLSEIDPDGQVFRFNRLRDGGLSLENTRIVNLEILAEAMDYVRDAIFEWHTVGDYVRELNRIKNRVRLAEIKTVLREQTVQGIINTVEAEIALDKTMNPSAQAASSDFGIKLFKMPTWTAALIEVVKSLSENERAELLALAWLGRGSAGEHSGEWNELVANAKEGLTDQYDYIVGLLTPDYLKRGLKLLHDDGLWLAT
jgi:Protein of unknown function (DUF3775)